MSIPEEDLLLFNDTQPEQDELDYEFRIVLLTQPFNTSTSDNSINVEQSQLEERILSNITTFTKVNEFFDNFDELIAYPNQSQIKYDVGSDGMCVVVVDNDDMKGKVLEFIDQYLITLSEKDKDTKGSSNEEEEDDEEQKGTNKRQRK
ncbi:hypothetical protein CANARDRAFT_27450 [[Candida] arabinofermentans NRRL YB-2248]|uniref:Uncharacterized protein n=1 Tax=[Candida] arabinofermentans NRRL YB-2248 TaxID=983967 RepID=A0A1E4T343_9ASCO|nr:hypothetical protein CANARDRAFT_27450 [[Candida] arabinofermentans NRRL YB-2248]